ncbi:MAG: type IX secretion system membrane protein PorP/SprF [Sphingobacteriaceae bacterium]|nr:type IX secretion system membrane protein PorP/SprF [Sphingobacteriaceae bacterium]
MRFYNVIFGVLALLTGSAPSFAQQNIQLTQYIFNSLSVNPAYAGYKEQWFAQMALRNQWTGIEDAPKTGHVSVDGILDPDTKKMGIGIQIGADRLGPQSSTSAYVNYAYRLQLDDRGKKRLSFGIGAGVSQLAVDYSKLTPIDGGDDFATQGQTSKFVPDFRFGVYYNSPKWYIGASALDLLSSQTKDATAEGIILNKRHLYLISGLLLDINPETRIRPSFLVKEDFKGPTSLDLNSMVIFRDKFWIGASYRTAVKLWKKNYENGQSLSTANSVAGIAQFFISPAFRIGYSYDYSMSRLSSIESGSHEITLGLTFSQNNSRILTPRFF